MYYIKALILLSKAANITFLSYILFELLDVEHGSPISHKNATCNSLGLVLAIDPPPSGAIFVHYFFPDTTLYKPQHEICKLFESGSVTYVTRKITLNVSDNVSKMTYLHSFEVTVTQFWHLFYKCLEFLPLYMLLGVSYVISKYQYCRY